MSTALATVDANRLAKLVRLAFSSDKDGEIVAAVAAAKRLLASGNVDAHWLADRLTAQAIVPVAKEHHDDDDDRSAVWFAFHHRDRLTPRDRQFIEGLTRWHGTLSAKQRKWLADILAKIEEAA